MFDPESLRGTAPRQPSPSGGAAAARRAGRRRLLVIAGISVPSTAAVAAVAAVLLASGPGADGLSVVDPAGHPSPASTTAQRTTPGTRAGAPLPAPSVAQPAGALGPSSSSPNAPNAGRTNESPDARTHGSTKPSPTRLAMVPYDSSVPCHQDSNDQINGWCTRSPMPNTVRSGGSIAVAYEICRTVQQSGTLKFPDSTDATFDLYDPQSGDSVGGLVMATNPNAGAHDLQVPAETCARWSSTWRAFDWRGHLMPRGTYNAICSDQGRTYYHQGVVVNAPGNGFTFTVT